MVIGGGVEEERKWGWLQFLFFVCLVVCVEEVEGVCEKMGWVQVVKNLVEKKGEFCELWQLWWEEEGGGGVGGGFGVFVGLVVLGFGDFFLVGCGDLKGCW